MKKKLGLLLAAVTAISMLGTTAVLASSSPLEKYSLYDDVMGGGSSGNQDRERATSDFYANSMRPGSGTNTGAQTQSEEQKQAEADKAAREQKAKSLQEVIDSANTGEMVGPRNKALRASSRNVYSDLTQTDPWKKDISFYTRPTLAGIRANYKKSNFAGALQESISLVNHKNFSSLTREQRTMAYYYLAMCYTKCGQPENAVRAYEKVISLHDSPMIVKYATNGRNCVLRTSAAGQQTETTGGAQGSTNAKLTDDDVCYPNVNIPEFVRPNEHIADTISPADLVPIDPNTLISKNMKKLQTNMVPTVATTDANGKTEEEKPLNLPFGTQDAELDKFINAPYGNGLSPKFNDEYKEIQLRTIQKEMNAKTGSAMPVEEVPEVKAEPGDKDAGGIPILDKFFQPQK